MANNTTVKTLTKEERIAKWNRTLEFVEKTCLRESIRTKSSTGTLNFYELSSSIGKHLLKRGIRLVPTWVDVIDTDGNRKWCYEFEIVEPEA